MEMYIRWRADTTRLQLRLDEQKPRNEPDGEDVATSTAQAVVKRITGEIAQNFFATLLRATSSEVTLPIQLFETEGEDAAKQLRRFEQKLQDCVEAAMDLYRYMRRSKAHWSFDWVESNTLDEETMDFCEEQKTAYTEEVMRARAKKGQLEVLYCITPVLAKYGDDDGQDFRRRKVLQTAKVVVARIPEESRTLGSVWKQTKDQVATNNSVKGSAESERDGASTDRGRDTHQTDEPQPSRWATPRIFSGIY